MAEVWFYAVNGARSEAVDFATVQRMASQGALPPNALVWKEGWPQWVTAGSIQGLIFREADTIPATLPHPLPSPVPVPGPAPAPVSAPAPAPAAGAVPPVPDKGLFKQMGQKLSDAAGLPTIGDVPVQEILTGGLSGATKKLDIEETFAAGTLGNTPALAQIETGWPRPSVFWRILFVSLGAYYLMRLGFTEFQNQKCVPGMMVLGAFAVPFSLVVFFFEMNTPRNVSTYQVGKMLVLGGILGILSTLFFFQNFRVGMSNPYVGAILVGIVEESAKALALLLIVREARYRWQLNGALLGAAVGAGFAGFETAGYAFEAMLKYNMSFEAITQSLSLRGILAPGGHVIWTAIIGAAIWKAKGDKPFNVNLLFTPVVIRRWSAAVILHSLWDMDLVTTFYFQYIVISIVGWYLTFATLKEGFRDIEEAKKQPGVMPMPAAA
ncbi:MAG: PrsW family intramembrane metalloprotease [Planctomycetota bacterium]|nr:PrsW family intramembrane metalloprotease [Planctomycetota bacterium]